MINITEFKKLQKLAKLNFEENELDEFSKKMSNIVNMINTIQEIDCDNIEPLKSVCDIHQRMREDVIELSESNLQESLFRNVPKKGSEIAKEVKCFIVPKVIE